MLFRAGRVSDSVDVWLKEKESRGLAMHVHTGEHAHTHFSGGSIVYLQHHSSHAGCWKLPLCGDVLEGCEKKKSHQNKEDRKGRVAGGLGVKEKGSDGRGGLKKKEKKSLLINVGFEAPLLLDPPARWRLPRGRAGGREKTLLVFLKAQKGWRWGESGGWKGEEEVAGLPLSSISRHSEKDGAFFPTRIIIPVLLIHSRDLLIAPFHHRMSFGNIPSVRLDQECLTSKCLNHQLPCSRCKRRPPPPLHCSAVSPAAARYF